MNSDESSIFRRDLFCSTLVFLVLHYSFSFFSSLSPYKNSYFSYDAFPMAFRHHIYTPLFLKGKRRFFDKQLDYCIMIYSTKELNHHMNEIV
jgi:hypothetical protein